MTNFTPEDLIRYLYNETNATDTEEITRQLQNDWTLNEKFKVLKASFDRLNKLALKSPRQQSVDSIMNYATSAKVSV